LNREWLFALAQSGSPLFVSCKPGILSEEEEKELQKAFEIASLQKDEFIPLDWMETTTPSRYLLNGEEISFITKAISERETLKAIEMLKQSGADLKSRIRLI
jgi:alpha-galactosidase